jgi:endonuclease YncB( thermonuclease family)
VIGKQWPFGTGNQTVPVLDGDIIEVLHTHHPERIRLSGIDCPEKSDHLPL